MSVVLVIEWSLLMLITGAVARTRGAGFGLAVAGLCSVFWAALCFVVVGPASFSIWMVTALGAGVGAILVVGFAPRREETGRHAVAPLVPITSSQPPQRPKEKNDETQWVRDALSQFDDWLERYRGDADPWPHFAEFVRGLLGQHCGAQRVVPYRALGEDDVLVPLQPMESAHSNAIMASESGVVADVVRQGRSFLAAETDEWSGRQEWVSVGCGPVAWAFPVRQANRNFGMVTAGELGSVSGDQVAGRDRLRTMEQLLSLFWATLIEACRSRVSAVTEPVTGLLTRKAFVEAGEVALAESYRRSEPIALLVVAIEGLRALDDAGRWAHCNALIGQAGQILALRCRANDLLARFDESRFVMLLRRVDRELAALIAAELVSKLNAIDLSDIEGTEGIVFRGGLSVPREGDRPPLADLVAEAVQNCHDARRRQEPVGMATTVRTSRVSQ